LEPIFNGLRFFIEVGMPFTSFCGAITTPGLYGIGLESQSATREKQVTINIIYEIPWRSNVRNQQKDISCSRSHYGCLDNGSMAGRACGTCQSTESIQL
jgi:hypothetical protein